MQLEDVILRNSRASQPVATAVPIGTLYFVTDEGVLERSNGTIWQSMSASAAVATRAIAFVIDGGGAAITSGVKGDLSIPYACTITAAKLLADQSGSIIVNIWKDSYGSYPPVVGDKITASAPPTLSGAIKSNDTTLTGWTTAIAAGDTLRFNVDALATSITKVTLTLTVTV